MVALAVEEQRLGRLTAIVGCGDEDSSLVCSVIVDYLLDSTELEVGLETVKLNYFGYRLGMVMELLKLSNVKLAKMVNIDASLISRFRNGFRSLKSNHALLDIIGNQLYRQIIKEGMQKQASTLTGIRLESLNIESFSEWLYTSDVSTMGAERLIKAIGSFSYNGSNQLLSLEQCVDLAAMSFEQDCYLGIDGIREAAKRFLGTAIMKNGRELLLYSDQDMEWMNDPVFVKQWASLMVYCIKAGIKVHIIHNIRCEMNEMLDGITKWIPLYMSGCIYPYYSQGKYDANGFTHTLFIAPGLAAIEGSGSVDHTMHQDAARL